MPIFLGESEESLARYSFDPENQTNQSDYERTYYVLSDYVSQSESAIVSTLGIPARFSSIGTAICIDHDVKAINRVAKNPRTGTAAVLYEVKCKFTSDLGEDDIPSGGDPDLINPLEYRPKVSWKSRSEERELRKDHNGNFIETTAYEPLIVVAPKIIPILTVKKFEVWPFPPLKIFEFVGRTNLTEFYGAPPETALMTSITSEETVINGKLYTDVTYEVEFDIEVVEDPIDAIDGLELGDFFPNTQRIKVLNNGYQYLPFDIPLDQLVMPTTNTDVNGIPQRINLTETGERAEPTDPPIYLEFKNKSTAEFNSLGLGPF